MQTSYLVAEIVMIPLSGWLSRALSTRVLYTLSALGFTVFSALCASASSLGRDDPVAGAAGLYRRGDDPDGVRHRAS